MKDYYATLGVSRNATKEDIKKSYKHLAKKYHPDVSKEQNSAEKFKEITEAYDVLGDEKKKTQYDTFGTTENQTQEGYSPFSGFGFDLGDIFEDFFGQRKRTSGMRGNDLEYALEITLEEVALGTKKKITTSRMEICSSCNGKGSRDENSIKSCEECHGTGYAKRSIRTPFGYFSQTSPCEECQGEGSIITEPCKTCDALGRVQKERTIEIEIPRGVMSGFKLRIPGGGDTGIKQGQPGDLYIILYVKEHKLFERDGQDVLLKTPISFSLAALGGELDVPTLFSTVKLSIPQGTQTHTVFRLKGKGLPSLHGNNAGNELVQVIVETPSKLTTRQKELLAEFDKTYTPKRSFMNTIWG